MMKVAFLMQCHKNMPFYYAGFLYGQFDDRMKESETGKKMIDSVVAICFVMWLFVILRFSLYEMSDGGAAIILRAATSLAGCIAVCGLCKGIFSEKSGGVPLHGSESTHWKCTSLTICYSA